VWPVRRHRHKREEKKRRSGKSRGMRDREGMIKGEGTERGGARKREEGFIIIWRDSIGSHRAAVRWFGWYPRHRA